MKAVVVGGGLGGLLVAAELRRRDFEVTLFEADSQVGGVARTITRNGYLLEPAAGSFLLPDPALSPIIGAAGIDVAPIEGGNRRLYTTGSGFTDIPSSPSAFLRSNMVGPITKLRVIGEFLVRSRTSPGESLHSFLVRHFGERAGAIGSHLGAAGVFAGDSRAIEAAAFAPLIGLEAASGSLLKAMVARRKAGPGSGRSLHLPTGGMRELALGLANFVGDVRTDTVVTSIEITARMIRVNDEPADHVVMAVGPQVIERLMGVGAGSTPTVPVAVVGLGGPVADMGFPVDAFGLLAGPASSSPVLGILFERGPGRAPQGHQLAKVLFGGVGHGQILGQDDRTIIERTIADVGHMLGHEVAPTFTEIARREIPQYVAGHAARTADLARRLPQRCHLAGWWYRGIGLGSLAADARQIADRMAAS